LQKISGRRGGGARFDGVAHEHGDGHGADAAGDGSEGAGNVDRGGMDVADEGAAFGAKFCEAVGEVLKKALGFFRVGDAIGANVDDGSAGLDPAGLHEAGFAHGGDDDISAADNIGEIARLGMADGDGGVGVHEEKGHGLANDVAASEDDGVGAFERDSVAAQNFHAAGGSAGDQAGTSADEAAEVDGMEAVHVFGGIDGFEDALSVDLRRKGELNENAVNVVVAIEVFDDSEQIESGHGGWRREEGAGEAELFAGGDFAFDVELRSGIFADEDGSEAGTNASGRKQPYFIAQFGEDLVADFSAVEDACGHAKLAFALACVRARENHSTRKNVEA